MNLSLGFSPCPNDTFIFDALVNNRISNGDFKFDVEIEDVEKLNELSFEGRLDVTKMSFNAYAKISSEYQVLNAGAALGMNCGPLLVSKREYAWEDLSELRIVIPGVNTTANLLLSLFAPEIKNKRAVLFSQIEDAVLNDEADAGLIIHESRFTYEKKGLRKIADMGELWEQYTGAPLPLGCIAVKRSLPDAVKHHINDLVKQSVKYAFLNPDASAKYIRKHASDMSEEVQKRHIDLYVNKFSIDLGEQGRKAIELLFRKGRELDLLPEVTEPLFV